MGLLLIVATTVLGAGAPPVGATSAADAPLFENILVREGRYGLILTGNGGNASDVVLDLPEGSAVDTAHLYAALEGAPSSVDVSVNGIYLGATAPYAIDEADGTPRHVHRWDATSSVAGDGTYGIAVDVSEGFAYGHVLLVVYEAPSVGRAQILVNDGNEVLVERGSPPAQSSTFHGVRPAADAELYFGVYGGDPSGPFTGGPNEFAAFGGADLARGDTSGLPDAPWDGDDGDELDIDAFTVATVEGDNAARVGTGNDLIGWFLAALRVPIVDAPPTVAISSPAAGQEFQSSSVRVTGVAADDVGVARVEVRVNEGTWRAAVGTASWSIDLVLANGANRIEARAFDESGNPSSMATVDVTLMPPRAGADSGPVSLPVLVAAIAAAVALGVAALYVQRRSKGPRCPMCGNDVTKDLETCPSCGAGLRG